MEAETPTTTATTLGELIVSLEQATLMAKQLPSAPHSTITADQIYTSLQQAHHHLSAFLSQIPVAAENSISSATGGGGGDPMQVGDGDEVEVEKVEERMRDCCFVKNKRPKRMLSPSTTVAVVEEERIRRTTSGGVVDGLRGEEQKLRALDLVYQFHG